MSTKPLPPPAARNTHLLCHIRLLDEIEVWWPYDREYYPGKVAALLPDGRHRIHYNDGEVEELHLSTEQWRFRGDAARRVSSSLVSEPHAPGPVALMPASVPAPPSPRDAPPLEPLGGGNNGACHPCANNATKQQLTLDNARGCRRFLPARSGGETDGPDGSADARTDAAVDDDRDGLGTDDDDDDIPVRRVIRRRSRRPATLAKKVITKKGRPHSAEHMRKVKKEPALLPVSAMSTLRPHSPPTPKHPAKPNSFTSSAIPVRTPPKPPITNPNTPASKAVQLITTTPYAKSNRINDPLPSPASAAAGQLPSKPALSNNPAASKLEPNNHSSANSPILAKSISQSIPLTDNAPHQSHVATPKLLPPQHSQPSRLNEAKANASASGHDKSSSAENTPIAQRNPPPVKPPRAAIAVTEAPSQSLPPSGSSAIQGKPTGSKPGIAVKQRLATQTKSATPLLVIRKPDTLKTVSNGQRGPSASAHMSLKTSLSASSKPRIERPNPGRSPPQPRTLKTFAFVRRTPIAEVGDVNRIVSQRMDTATTVARCSSSTDKVSDARQATQVQRGDLDNQGKEDNPDVEMKDAVLAKPKDLPRTQTPLRISTTTGANTVVKTPENTRTAGATADIPSADATLQSGCSMAKASAAENEEATKRNAEKRARNDDDGREALLKSFCRIQSSERGSTQAGGFKDTSNHSRDSSSQNEPLSTRGTISTSAQKTSAEQNGSFSRMPKKNIRRTSLAAKLEEKFARDGVDTAPHPAGLNHKLDKRPARKSMIARDRDALRGGDGASRGEIKEPTSTPRTIPGQQPDSGVVAGGAYSLHDCFNGEGKKGPDDRLHDALKTARPSPQLGTPTPPANCEKVTVGNKGDSQRHTEANLEKKSAAQLKAQKEDIQTGAPSRSRAFLPPRDDMHKSTNIGDKSATLKGVDASKPPQTRGMDKVTSRQGALISLRQAGGLDSTSGGDITSDGESRNIYFPLGKRVHEEKRIPSKRMKLSQAIAGGSNCSQSNKLHVPNNTLRHTNTLHEPSLDVMKSDNPIVEATITTSIVNTQVDVERPLVQMKVAETVKSPSKLESHQTSNPQSLHISTEIMSDCGLSKESQQNINPAESTGDTTANNSRSAKKSVEKSQSFVGDARGNTAAALGRGNGSQNISSAPSPRAAVAPKGSQAMDRVAIKSLIGEPAKRSRVANSPISTRRTHESAVPSANLVGDPQSLERDIQFANADHERDGTQENCDILKLSEAQALQITEAVRKATALNQESNSTVLPSTRPQFPANAPIGLPNANGVPQAVTLHKALAQRSNGSNSSTTNTLPTRNTVQKAPVRQRISSTFAPPNATVATQQQISTINAAKSGHLAKKVASPDSTKDVERKLTGSRPIQRPMSSIQPPRGAKTNLNSRIGDPAPTAGTGMQQPSSSFTSKCHAPGRITQDPERGTASLPLDILLRSITESNWRTLQKGLGPLGNRIDANQAKTEERLSKIFANLSSWGTSIARLSNIQEALTKSVEQCVTKNSLISAVGALTMRTLQAIKTEISQATKDLHTALSQEFDIKLKLMTKPLEEALQKNTEAIQGLQNDLEGMITKAMQRGLENMFTTESPSNPTRESSDGLPTQDVVGDTDGANCRPSDWRLGERTRDCQEAKALGPCLPEEKMVEYENIALKARELTGRAVVEWMIYGGARERAPSTERQMAVSLDWVKETSKICAIAALTKLETYRKFEEAMADLKKTASAPHIEISWLVSGPTEDNLKKARVNYSEWDPQLLDFEWESERRVLLHTARELLRSEKELLANRNRIRDPLLCSIRCIQITRIRMKCIGMEAIGTK